MITHFLFPLDGYSLCWTITRRMFINQGIINLQDYSLHKFSFSVQVLELVLLDTTFFTSLPRRLNSKKWIKLWVCLQSQRIPKNPPCKFSRGNTGRKNPLVSQNLRKCLYYKMSFHYLNYFISISLMFLNTTHWRVSSKFLSLWYHSFILSPFMHFK